MKRNEKKMREPKEEKKDKWTHTLDFWGTGFSSLWNRTLLNDVAGSVARMEREVVGDVAVA